MTLSEAAAAAAGAAGTTTEEAAAAAEITGFTTEEAAAAAEIAGFTTEEAAAAAAEHYGLAASARALPGEFDLNFELETPDGRAFILKVSHPDTPDVQLDFENTILVHLRGAAVPETVQSKSGSPVARLPGGLRARLLVKLPGTLLADVRPRPAHLASELGDFLGRIDRLLAGFEHPGMHRVWLWDLGRAGEQIRAGLATVGEAEQPIVALMLERFEKLTAPAWGRLPAQVIHNDANDYNVLARRDLSGRWRICGLVDFGDALYAPRICEPAIAAAYLLPGEPDPLEVAIRVALGYHGANPLNKTELAIFWDLVCTRLAVSLAIAARRAQAGTGNVYHQVSAGRVVQALRAAAEVDPDRAREAALNILD